MKNVTRMALTVAAFVMLMGCAAQAQSKLTKNERIVFSRRRHDHES